ncbi:MAG: YihY/virulence factor BrkB family protein [Clostridia bacterium]|nr:YihY/virulence factor BrkB family protein [Clostridia bacterium]
MHRIIELYRYFSDKRFSTIAGTLVYFLIMSIVPFSVWLTLVCGNLNIGRFLSHELFESISPFLHYLKSSAESAASGAGIILLLTTLYSSTNFFYHLRRSGEIIYNSSRVKGGVKLRLVSLILIFVSIILLAVLAAFIVTGTWVLDKLLPYYISEIIIYTFITAIAFGVALVLNLFACPYKLKLSEVIPGSLLTTALWLVILIGFTIYMRFANPEKLYGKIAFIIIFLLWCYVMMSCFVIGVIYNGSFKTARKYKNLF